MAGPRTLYDKIWDDSCEKTYDDMALVLDDPAYQEVKR